MPSESNSAKRESAEPSWSNAAIAASAVLAGLALSRSGRLGLAAGVAAAASMKLMTSPRREVAVDRGELGTPISPPVGVAPEAIEELPAAK